MTTKMKNVIFLFLLALPTCTNVAVAQTSDTSNQISNLKQQLSALEAEKKCLEGQKCLQQAEKQNPNLDPESLKEKLLAYNACKTSAILLDIKIEEAIRQEEQEKKRNLTEDECKKIRNRIIQKEGAYYECEHSEK